MARGPRGPRKRSGPSKPQRQIVEPMPFEEDDEDIDLRDTPEYKRRMLITRIGTTILLVAFLGTSGITCIAGGMSEQPKGVDTPTVQQMMGDRLQAQIEELRKERKQSPDDTYVMGQLGYFLGLHAEAHPEAAEKDRAEARQLFEQALKKEPNNHKMYYYLGGLSLQQKDLAQAREHFTKSLEIAARPVPDDYKGDKEARKSELEMAQVESHVGLALVAHQEKKLDDSIKELDAALKLRPDYADGYLLRARVQIDRKQPEQARRDFGLAEKIAMSLSPSDQDRYRILAEIKAGEKMLNPGATPKPGGTSTPTPAAVVVTPTPNPVTNSTLPPANVTLPATNSTLPATNSTVPPVNGTSPP